MDRIDARVVDVVRPFWARWKNAILILAIAFMLVAGSVRMFNQGWRLLVDPGEYGAVDLRLRYGEVQRWFAGQPVYVDNSHSGYPPASYVVLWPLLGWLDEWPARYFWALTVCAALAALAAIAVRSSGAHTRLEQAFVGLFVVSVYPIPITVGNGQLGTHLLPAVLAGVLLIASGRPATWRSDLAAAVLLLAALVKPSLTLPFFWLVLFLPRRWRPILLVAFGYAILTLVAAAFQPEPLPAVFRDFLDLSLAVNLQAGYVDLTTWLRVLGLGDLSLPAVALAILALGAFVWQNRCADPWLLIGVSALVARVWTYHAVYDDSLLLLPAIAAFRVAARRGSTDRVGVLAGGLVALAWLTLQAPGGLSRFPDPWNLIYYAGLPVVWALLLVFLVAWARQESRTLGRFPIRRGVR